MFGFTSFLSTEDIINSDIILFSFNKKEVLEKDDKRFLDQIKNFDQAGKYGRGKLLITFDGYDHDSRETYQIPEINKFVRILVQKVPHIFYFLNVLGYHHINFYLNLCDTIQAVALFNGRGYFTWTSNKSIHETLLNATLIFAKPYKDSDYVKALFSSLFKE